MSRSVALAVSFLYQILLYSPLTLVMGQFNFYSRPQFNTVSISPSNGPMFLNAKTYLTVLPSNVPILPCSDVTFIPEPLILTEKTETILHKVHKRDEEVDEEIDTVECDTEEVVITKCDSEGDLEEIITPLVCEDIVYEEIYEKL